MNRITLLLLAGMSFLCVGSSTTEKPVNTCDLHCALGYRPLCGRNSFMECRTFPNACEMFRYNYCNVTAPCRFTRLCDGECAAKDRRCVNRLKYYYSKC